MSPFQLNSLIPSYDDADFPYVADHFYTDMGFNYARAGGAQVPAPGRGWIWGYDEYKVIPA